MIKDTYLLPLMEDQLDLLQNAAIFTALDVKTDSFMSRSMKNVKSIFRLYSLTVSTSLLKFTLIYVTPRPYSRSLLTRFVKEYSTIARPLTNLLKSGVEFTFGFYEQYAFNELKRVLINQPVLKLYKMGAKTELHTDAPKYGYGAISLQKDSVDNKFHPVHYASGKTTCS